MAAYMKTNGYAQLLQLYACGVENVNSGYVRSTKHELIGRILGIFVEFHITAFLCYSVLGRMISLADEGNDRAWFLGTAWVLVAWYIMLFGKPKHDGTGGTSLVFILLVDWILRLVWPKDTDVAEEPGSMSGKPEMLSDQLYEDVAANALQDNTLQKR